MSRTTRMTAAIHADTTESSPFTRCQSIQYGTPGQKWQSNLDAIRSVLACSPTTTADHEVRLAQPAPMASRIKASQYVGWGDSSLAARATRVQIPSFGETARLRDLPSDHPDKLKRVIDADLVDAMGSHASKKLVDQLRHSTLNAHYTPPQIYRFIWNHLIHLGLNEWLESRTSKGDPVHLLEPSCGIGSAVASMPDGMHDLAESGGLSVTMVDLDPITAYCAKVAQPGARVLACGIQSAGLPASSYDIVISNVPFGNYQVADSTMQSTKLCNPIHDYFFHKSIQLARPGAVIALITSHFSLNKLDRLHRSIWVNECELLDAIMLPGGPTGAFKESAGTEVVTCVVFLQKRSKPIVEWVRLSKCKDSTTIDNTIVDTIKANHPDQFDRLNRFITTGTKQIDVERRTSVGFTSYQASVTVSRWFLTYPSATFGKIGADGTMYSGAELSCTLYPDTTLDSVWTAYLSIIQPHQQRINPARLDSVTRSLSQTAGAHLSPSDRVAGVVPAHPNQAEAVQLLKEIYVCLRTYLDQVAQHVVSDTIEATHTKLKQLYHLYRLQFGAITVTGRGKRSGGPIDAFVACGAASTLRMLENQDGTPSSIVSTGLSVTVAPIQSTDPVDVMYQCLDRNGSLDLDWIGESCGLSRADVIERLGDAIFLDPEQGWITRDEYLSGDMRVKLARAKQAALLDRRFERNISAIESVLPARVPFHAIFVQFGSTWVPVQVYRAFLGWLTERPSFWESLQYCPELGRFIGVNSGTLLVFHSRTDVIGMSTSRVTLLDVLMAAINHEMIKVYDTVGSGDDERRVLNVTETAMAQACITRVNESFNRWVRTDQSVQDTIESAYNESFVSVVPRRFDGSHLSFDSLNPSYTLRPYQRNAVARILATQSGHGDSVCITHQVGFGKTLTALAAVFKSIQIGKAKRVILVIKKALRSNWIEAIKRFYPSEVEQVFAFESKHLGAGRAEFLARIGSGQFKVILMTYEQFNRIPVASSTLESFFDDENDSVRRAIEAFTLARDESGVKALKRAEKMIATAQSKLMDQYGGVKRDQHDMTIESLGIDMVVADEAHVWKNDLIQTRIEGVKGINSSNPSKRALDARIKAESIKRSGGVWVELTGTPVSNSIAETFVVMRRLQRQTLRSKGIDSFDAWQSVFCERVTRWERNSSGGGSAVTRLNFANLPELNALLGNSWDRIAQSEAVDASGQDRNAVVLPSLATGGVIVCETTGSPELVSFVQQLADRKRALQQAHGSIEPEWQGKPDNHLWIDGDGRKASTFNASPYAGWTDLHQSGAIKTKVDQLVQNVLTLHRQYDANRAVQAIFCDLFTPSTRQPLAVYGGSERAIFEMEGIYGIIRSRLVAGGIDEDSICYIHDAEDEDESRELESDLNEGTMRIVLGSSGRMGEGRNIQERMIALHHFDVPWTPAALQQRQGRIIRHGNTFQTVYIYAYVLQNSYDTVIWQIIRNKASFLSQLASGEVTTRRTEDVGDILITAETAMALASGDPRMAQVYSLEADLNLLLSEYRDAASRSTRASVRMSVLPGLIRTATSQLESHRYAAEAIGDMPATRSSADVLHHFDRYVTGMSVSDLVSTLRSSVTVDDQWCHAGEMAGVDLWIRRTVRAGVPTWAGRINVALSSDGTEWMHYSDELSNSAHHFVLGCYDLLRACRKQIAMLQHQITALELERDSLTGQSYQVVDLGKAHDLLSRYVGLKMDMGEMITTRYEPFETPAIRQQVEQYNVTLTSRLERQRAWQTVLEAVGRAYHPSQWDDQEERVKQLALAIQRCKAQFLLDWNGQAGWVD